MARSGPRGRWVHGILPHSKNPHPRGQNDRHGVDAKNWPMPWSGPSTAADILIYRCYITAESVTRAGKHKVCHRRPRLWRPPPPPPPPNDPRPPLCRRPCCCCRLNSWLRRLRLPRSSVFTPLCCFCCQAASKSAPCTPPPSSPPCRLLLTFLVRPLSYSRSYSSRRLRLGAS